VWHGSLRTAPGDRVLGDAEWAEAAEQLVAANGLEGCRWVAVRHDDDHVHVAAVMVGSKGDRKGAEHWTPCPLMETDSHLHNINYIDRRGLYAGKAHCALPRRLCSAANCADTMMSPQTMDMDTKR
jgi:hypothetical protein